MSATSQVRSSFMHWIESSQAPLDLLIPLCSVPLGCLFGNSGLIEHCSGTMLHHRPGARHVVFYRLRVRQPESAHPITVDLIGKCDTPKSVGKSAREFQVLQSLWTSGFGCNGRFKIPRPIYLSPDRQMVLQEKARGLPLSAMMYQGAAPALESIRSAGIWIARLHHLTIAPAGVVSYADQLAAARLYVSEILVVRPSWASTLQLVEAQIHHDLTSCEAVPLAFIHGDYHPQHVYVSGRNVTAIDFDRSRFSDPAEDLGCFIAHARAAADAPDKSPDTISDEIRAFLNGYFSVAPDPRAHSLARRVAAFVALFSLEALYYTASVLGLKDDLALDVYLNSSKTRDLLELNTVEEFELTGPLRPSGGNYPVTAA